MKYAFKCLMIAVSTILLAGCAITDTTVPLNYTLPQNSNILHTKQPVKINVSVSDSRGDGSRVIIHKTNMYNETMSGTFIADQPVTTIVRNALIGGFRSMGYRVAEYAPYRISAEILSLDSQDIMGFFEGTVGLKLVLDVRVYNIKNNRIIWQDVIEGTGRVKTAIGDDTSTIRTALSNALTNAIRQMQRSQSLVDALKKPD